MTRIDKSIETDKLLVVEVVVDKIELWKNWLMGKMFYFEVIEMFVFKRKEYIFCNQTEAR